jgi:hypothetical protein
MNEKLKQLAMECNAWEQVYNPHKFMVDRTFDVEKFADLIVAECLEACSRANEIRHFVPPTQEQVVLSCMREIEHHFGIEE